MRAMARMLGRAASTISPELGRNAGPTLVYASHTAQVQSPELELQTLREQESAQAARVELAKAQLKVEAADSRVAEAQQRETKALADTSRVSAALDAERTARAGAESRAAVAESQLASTTGALQAGQARVQELQAAVKEHDTVVARVAGAEAMANELRSTVEMLRELLKAAEERSARRNPACART